MALQVVAGHDPLGPGHQHGGPLPVVALHRQGGQVRQAGGVDHRQRHQHGLGRLELLLGLVELTEHEAPHAADHGGHGPPSVPFHAVGPHALGVGHHGGRVLDPHVGPQQRHRQVDRGGAVAQRAVEGLVGGRQQVLETVVVGHADPVPGFGQHQRRVGQDLFGCEQVEPQPDGGAATLADEGQHVGQHQVAGGRELPGGHGVAHRGVHVALVPAPGAGPGVQDRPQSGFAHRQLGPQQLGEQVVIAVLAALGIEGHQEQVARLGQLGQQPTAPGPLEHRVAGRARQPTEHR